MRWDLIHYLPTNKPLPCPVCRTDKYMWAGVAGYLEAGVACSKCRLRVILPVGRIPPGRPVRGPWEARQDWVYACYTYDAIKTWNKIPRKGGRPCAPPTRS